jgi:hypothetical protein
MMACGVRGRQHRHEIVNACRNGGDGEGNLIHIRRRGFERTTQLIQ